MSPKSTNAGQGIGNTSTATAAGGSTYTNLHLSAITFTHPSSPPNIKQCPCEAHATLEQGRDQNKLIRVYYTEPSRYGYNQGCYLVKETRYSTLQRWHAPSDDLVADDAAAGSPVVAVGWWMDGGESGDEVWQTRVYYVDKNGMLRERTNCSSFAPTVKEDFESELPKPEKLVPPTPGWKLTPVANAKSASVSDTAVFPAISPLPTTKLAAVCSADGKIHVFYQASDNSIRELVFEPGKGWIAAQGSEDEVASLDKAKPGTPLAAISGGWAEVRLFYVTPEDLLAQVYRDDHTSWVESKPPQYKLFPTAMLAAVAQNYASPFFEMRVYTTDDNDDLYELSFSRNSGGWAPAPRSVREAVPEDFSAAGTIRLSAVAAIIVEGEWKTKVYFHPQRPIVAEWDVCAKAPTYASISNVSKGAAEKRRIEEETRAKIREEEERKKREAAVAPMQRKLQEFKSVKQGGSIDVSSNPEVSEKLQKVSGCASGYTWNKEAGGWRCAGGAHFITDAQFNAL